MENTNIDLAFAVNALIPRAAVRATTLSTELPHERGVADPDLTLARAATHVTGESSSGAGGLDAKDGEDDDGEGLGEVHDG